MTSLQNLQIETARNILLTHCPKYISVLFSLINLFFVLLFSTLNSMTCGALFSHQLLILPCTVVQTFTAYFMSCFVSICHSGCLTKEQHCFKPKFQRQFIYNDKLEVKLKGK